VRVLYLATSGSADPTLASIPLHVAVNGSAAIGQEASIVLLGDATELALPDIADTIEGVGLPPVRELLQKVREQQIPVAI
jgi:predicted peroxiredoxin